ncbi:SH3 domain protein [Ancylostoma duodenale]|uniref:SH3 domain protein n=1 Tax=Ancylostoma duodenale TaxID=51022 RepID=A0A0C2CIK9_9BILA|nr:SH3 domain protein [Ancylostoma duodenale]
MSNPGFTLQLTSLVLSLSLFKFLQKLWRYLLVLLRLKPANYASAAELAWGEAKEPFGSDVLGGSSPPIINWPAVMFWMVALGGPWLIYKAISQMVRSVEEKRKWATGTGAHYTAQALYDFQAANDQELSFMNGEILRVAPKQEQPRVRGWLLARNVWIMSEILGIGGVAKAQVEDHHQEGPILSNDAEIRTQA